MKRILCAVLITVSMAAPALAAKVHKAPKTYKVYLKEGGVIEARKVWRFEGKVHVWAEKDSMTSQCLLSRWVLPSSVRHLTVVYILQLIFFNSRVYGK